MLIELGILVLPQSRTKAVDVGINYANQTTTGQREQFFKARYLVGRVFLNLVFFWSLPFRFSDPLCYVFFLVWVSHYLDEMWLNTQAGPYKGNPSPGQSFTPLEFLPVF